MKKMILRNMSAVLLIFFIGLIGGCKNDPLDMTPNGRINLDDVFNDNNLTGAYLNSVYTNIPAYGSSHHSLALLAGITDEANESNGGIIGGVLPTDWYNGALSPSNLFALNWYGQYWQGIRQANVFLSYIDNANVNDPRDRTRWKAEAKVLRAFFYFELVKQFGPMPVQDEAFPLDFDYVNLERGSFDAVVQFVVQNCDEAVAESNLPYRIVNPNERGRFTKATALAIKSQALLFNASPLWNPENDVEKWKAAADGNRSALELLTSNGYQLYDDYEEYFRRESDMNNNPSDKETIYEQLDPANMHLIFVSQAIPSLPGSAKAGACPSQELVDSYDMMTTGEPAILGYSDANHLQPIINPVSGYDENNPYNDRDPRFYMTVFYNGAYFGEINGREHYIEAYTGGADAIRPTDNMSTHTGYYLRKFIDPALRQGDGIISASRWKKYRLGEIYLNYAEAENEANGPTEAAYQAVNTIRRRVGMKDLPVALSKEQLRDRIHRERRVELAFEEHRFWDVRRWKILDQTDKFVTGMRWTRTGNMFSGSRFVVDNRNSWQDRFRLFPIPLAEIAKMPNFSQNPGW